MCLVKCGPKSPGAMLTGTRCLPCATGLHVHSRPSEGGVCVSIPRRRTQKHREGNALSEITQQAHASWGLNPGLIPQSEETWDSKIVLELCSPSRTLPCKKRVSTGFYKNI